MKAFISYSTVDRTWAAETKQVLDRLGIMSFMAHDDLVVSEEWKERIIEELNAAEIFICLLSKDFKASDWCAQELGFVFGRSGVVIIPLSIDGTTPFGFISHIQSQSVQHDWLIEDRIVNALLRRRLELGIAVTVKRMLEVRDYRVAEQITRRVMPFFPIGGIAVLYAILGYLKTLALRDSTLIAVAAVGGIVILIASTILSRTRR